MTLQSAASDLALIEAAARAAGALARELVARPLEIQSKGEAGPVTNVDFAVNDLLTERLRGARPDYGWLSEESPDEPAARGLGGGARERADRQGARVHARSD
mgnify:CR=1 FL=1